MHKLYDRLSSRVALNVYYWLFNISLLLLNFAGSGRTYRYNGWWYALFTAICMLLLATVLYINNLWLVPKYLINKRVGKYFLLIAIFTYILGLAYAGLFEWLDVHLPLINMHDISAYSAMRIGPQTPFRLLLEGISWAVTLGINVFLFTVAWYMQDYKRQKALSEAAQQKQVETELNFLKSQINPHFLFNTLNNLYTLTIKKADEAPEVVSKLATILRYLLYESNVKEVSFEKEKEMMEAYIDLELLRLSNKDNMHFSISADQPRSIPPLLWVPVLENVFKHGTRYISNAYSIDYKFSIKDNTLYIYSRNTFKPADKNGGEQAGGIGIANLQKRLRLLYPGRYVLNREQEGNNYITQLQIQLA